jgi:RimJ/RimL family protein N-acetyltransferase
MSPLPLTIATSRLDLVWLSASDLRDVNETGTFGATANPCQLLTAGEAGLAEFFAQRVEANALHATWTIRAIIDRDRNELVGHAGFHLAPDADALVEVGYHVGETFRRDGIAREAVRGLIDAAWKSGEVETIRGCTAPTNAISKHLLTSLGFSFVGMVDDEEDGPEECYLLPRSSTTFS